MVVTRRRYRPSPTPVPRSAGEDEGVALAAAAAQRHRSGAGPPAHELVHGVDDEAVAGRADRMPDRNAAAVDVDHVVREAELGLRPGHHRTEGLVDLDEVEVAH